MYCTTFNGTVLLDLLLDVADSSISALAGIDMQLTFGVQLQVNLSNITNLTLASDPLVATIKIDATPLLALNFGFIEMLSNAKANATGMSAICICSSCNAYPNATNIF